MKCATRANGRRAAQEQRKQKDLNELPLQFTQIFQLIPVYLDTKVPFRNL